MAKRGPHPAAKAALSVWLAWRSLTRCERSALGLPATDKAFAAAHGVTDRTLRNWRKRYGEPEPAPADSDDLGTSTNTNLDK